MKTVVNPEKSKRIFIIDDDTDVRESLAEVLSLAGFEVDTAGDGEEGLRHLEVGNLPDLILLDLMMPKKSGYQFRIEQQQNPRTKNVPVIVMSAHDTLGDSVVKCLKAKDFLRKPMSLDVLLQKVNTYLH